MEDNALFQAFARLWDGSERKPSSVEVQAAFEVVNRRDLWSRTDAIHAGAVVLLHDATDALKQAALMLLEQLEQRATTPDLLKMIEDAISIAQDGSLLAAVNPETNLSHRLFSNRYVYWGIAATVGLQLGFVYLPLPNQLFHSHPLDVRDWIAPVAVAGFSAVALEKRFWRGRRNTT